MSIGNQKLKKLDKVKFLGVIIDDNLNWEPHIDQELADFIYAGTEKGFTLCGYDRDSWKK